jgi:hypothetical protein
MTESKQTVNPCEGCHWSYNGKPCSLPDIRPNSNGTCVQRKQEKKKPTNNFSAQRPLNDT